MPFVLLAVIALVLCVGSFLPIELKEGLYALSLTIKNIIVLLLPVIIFGLLFKATVMLSTSAVKMIGMLLVFVCGSNFTSTFLSHYVGEWVFHFDLSFISPRETYEGLQSLWQFDCPKWIANDKAMLGGVILGLLASKWKTKAALSVAMKIEQYINYLLQGVVYVIPLFVMGFVIKLQFDGVIMTLIKEYTTIFVFVALAQFSYILTVYFLLNKGRISAFVSCVKQMLPGAISGFSTMSSAASMPLTIIGAKNNAHNKELAQSVIPATVNIHLVGDCFAIPIFAYAILKSFGMPCPHLLQYLIFVGYFVLAKFSVAAIPGGGIIVMLPILEHYLGFNADMLSLITALYILFDPVITAANVLGNGAFSKGIDNWMMFLEKRKYIEAV